MNAAGSSVPDLQRLLYVTNNDKQRVDIFDIAAGHEWLRSFPMAGSVVGGVCADAATNRLFICDTMRGRLQIYEKDEKYSDPQFNL